MWGGEVGVVGGVWITKRFVSQGEKVGASISSRTESN